MSNGLLVRFGYSLLCCTMAGRWRWALRSLILIHRTPHTAHRGRDRDRRFPTCPVQEMGYCGALRAARCVWPVVRGPWSWLHLNCCMGAAAAAAAAKDASTHFPYFSAIHFLIAGLLSTSAHTALRSGKSSATEVGMWSTEPPVSQSKSFHTAISAIVMEPPTK